MKKWLKTSAAIIMAGALIVGCSSDKSSSDDGNAKANSGETTVLKLGHVWPESEIHAQAAEKFAKEVEEVSDGKLKIEIYGDGTLGDDKDLLEGLKVGTADIWMGGAGVLSSASETANIFTVPFMFESQDHFNKVFDGEIGKEISEKILEESQYKILSYWTRGARWLTVNKEVKTPEDLKGIKVRVPDSPMFVKSFEQLGAAPTPMAFGEVFTSLQQGVIDGQENPLSLIYNSKFNEVVDYLVKTEHVREPISVVISGSKFDSLSPELQKILEDAANNEGKTFAAEEVEKGDSTYLTGLEEAGMKVVEPDLGEFQDKLDGFVDKEFPNITEIYEKIRAVK
ncbi:TRAP transporter substrate-binding protein [Bacillus canaveralius]|uniref:TRAP transporter substrate-binding protein n=1 Tax=Bacillus canaveralius TaxID=1403243 RepID=UPI000F7A91FF|nr:TRAP transporter substrate-binding protein [Bacillus canaveralius]RSK55159.1 TRAP transporter substrate-binding protein [Bacillus canaveralius]